MQFWGTVMGRTTKTVERGGTKESGLEVNAAGWKGRITVYVYYNEEMNRDEFRVLLRPHWQDSDGRGKEIAAGILDVDELKDPFVPALIA
jgi:hypothetical protein